MHNAQLILTIQAQLISYRYYDETTHCMAC